MLWYHEQRGRSLRTAVVSRTYRSSENVLLRCQRLLGGRTIFAYLHKKRPPKDKKECSKIREHWGLGKNGAEGRDGQKGCLSIIVNVIVIFANMYFNIKK